MSATNPALLLESCYFCLGMSQFEAMQLSLWDSMSQSMTIDPVADFIARAGITDQTQIDAVTALHAAAVDHGWWDKCDLIYPFVGGTTLSNAQNLKSAQFTITWFGDQNSNNGAVGNGVSAYGDTGYIPSTSSLLTLDSAHLGIYRGSVGSNFRTYSGVVEFSFNKGFTTFLTNINSSASASSTSAVLGWSVGSKIDAANVHLFHDGVDTSAVAASTSVPTFSLFVLALNSSGVASAFSTSNLAGLTAGAGLSFAEYQLMAADWSTFNAALGR